MCELDSLDQDITIENIKKKLQARPATKLVHDLRKKVKILQFQSIRPHRRTPTSAPRMDHQSANSDDLMMHIPTGLPRSVGHSSTFNLQGDLPKVVVRA
ncbi:hypothetical protein C5167_049634 [Papaver somniferum]|uniref:Uncharacterized protein n=1 Tax=Papaver somniferum TaxID=3469 RepID=A0A4Y7KPR8_PAPSO|nr:hypothetical protein C5167_049634 [Papaver somniferum]